MDPEIAEKIQGGYSSTRVTASGLLLATKLLVPHLRPSCVLRPRLVARLDKGIHGKLVLVSAPAGFGKTTLVSEWLQRGERPSAWLSLDEGDNDPVRFLAYLVAALQQVNAEWGRSVQAALGARELPAIAGLVVELINEIVASDADFVLVLDDYHLISSPPIHEVLVLLLDRMPRHMHLAILTRADPPLSLSRLRACGDLTEIRADDLRFTLEEAVAFLNEVMTLDLTQQQIAAVESRTEGWVTGLQLASLSLQGLARGDIASFIEAFAGSHRYVMDYLMEEVFCRQPSHVQEFLLQTSILDRLCGPLCDAVTGQANGREMLERLERSNLFTVPLDHTRHWYRYHRLFADLLRDRLRQAQPDAVPELHCRASVWYEQEGLTDEAFAHAVIAGDVQRAAHLAEAHAERLVRSGEVTTLLRWVEALPQEAVRSRPRLCVSYAWALFLTGQAGALEPWLRYAEAALSQPATLPSAGEEKQGLKPLQGEVDVLRLASARYEQGPARIVERCREALEQVDESDLFARGLLYLTLGIAHRLGGQIDPAIYACTEAARLCLDAGNTMAAMIATYDLSRLYGFQGRLTRAAETCRQVLESGIPAGLVAQRSPGLGLAHLGLARVLYEWNDLEAAERHAREGIALGEPGGSLVLLMRGYTLLARIRQARGDDQGAREAIRALGQAVGRREVLQTTRDEMAAYQALFAVMQGDLRTADRWARTVKPTPRDRLDTLREFQWLILARVLIARCRSEEASPLLARLLQAAESEGRMGRAIEILVLQALCLQAQARSAEAQAVLRRALVLAEPEGYVRTFVDEGAPMAAMLGQALSQNLAPRYIGLLLAAFAESSAVSPLIEPLTRREREVLRLIADGLKNQEIADRLVISVATVKRHVTNIYGKLGIGGRVRAAARAQELGLL
jgi:LuxR family maltose regulon positive regulatory protein